MIDVTFASSSRRDGKPWLTLGSPSTKDIITTIVLVDSGYVLDHLEPESLKHLKTSIPRPSPRCLHLLSDYPALLEPERAALAAALGQTQAQGATTPRLFHPGGPEGLLEALCETEGYHIKLGSLYMIHPEGLQTSDWTTTALVGGVITDAVTSQRRIKAAKQEKTNAYRTA